MSTFLSKFQSAIYSILILILLTLYIFQTCETRQVKQELRQSETNAAKSIVAIQAEYQNLNTRMNEIDAIYKEQITKENDKFTNEKKEIDKDSEKCIASLAQDDSEIETMLNTYKISVFHGN
jgi:small-conductance mechanosensitive channel